MDRFRVLHLRRIREHVARSALSVVGIASGVALVVAMAALLTSTTATAKSVVDLLGGARYELVAPGGVDSSAIDDLTATPGVTGVRRFVETPVLINGEAGWLLAIDREATGPDPSASSLDTPEARALAAADGVQVGSEISSSQPLRITGITGETRDVTPVGSADGAIEDRYGGSFIVAPMEVALELRGLPAPDSLLVYGDPDLDDLRGAVESDGSVRPTSERVKQAERTIQILFSSLSILGSMGLIVGGFLLFNTMNMAVLDRRYEIALLRALGSNRRSIRRGLLMEAALLGAVGSALGVVVGVGMASGVVAMVPDGITRAIGTPLDVSVPAVLLFAVWVLGVLTALIGAMSPARRALRVDPLEALRPEVGPTDERASKVRWLPLVAGAVLVAVAAFASEDVLPAGVAFGLVIPALLALVYGGAPALTAAAAAVAQRLGTSGQLAAISLERSPRRVWATTATVVVSIAICVTAVGLSSNLRSTGASDVEVGHNSDFWIGTVTGDNIALTGLPLSWLDEIRDIPGVEDVAATRWIPTADGSDLVGVLSVFGDSSYAWVRLADDTAREALRAGEGAIVVKQYAMTFDVDIGDSIQLPGASPPLSLPVLDVTYGISPISGGIIAISSELAAEHYGLDTFTMYEAQLAPGADANAVQRRLEEIAGTADFPVHVYTSDEFVDATARSADQILALIAMVVVVIIACAGVAVLNTLLASVLERRRDVAVLRAVGAARRQIVRGVVCEAVAIGVAGGVLGTIAGSLFQWIAVERMGAITAFHVTYAFSLVTIILAVLAATGIILLGSSIPARRVSRLNLLEALRS